MCYSYHQWCSAKPLAMQCDATAERVTASLSCHRLNQFRLGAMYIGRCASISYHVVPSSHSATREQKHGT